jgi:hypothetical protein
MQRVRELLQQIANAEGRYSSDPSQHALNVIEDSQKAAEEALDLLDKIVGGETSCDK